MRRTHALRAPLGRRRFVVGALAAAFTAMPVGLAIAQDESASPQALETATRSGPVEAQLRLRPAAPAIGDPLELELEVRAEAGVEVLMPEFGEALGRFQIIDFAPSEKLDDDGATRSIQRYTLAPELSGPQRVPPLRVEFVDHRPGNAPAPEGEDAYELLTDALDFEVSSVLADGTPLELRPPLGELAPRPEPGRALPWLGGGAAALLLVGLALLAFRALASRERTQSAYAEARAALDALVYGGKPGAANPSERQALERFFVELSRIVRRYIEGRFALRSPELTTEEFLAELRRSPDLLRSHQELLADFLGTADLVKFARHTPGPEVVQRCLDAAERFLEATREADDSAAAQAASPASPAPESSPATPSEVDDVRVP